MKYFKVLGHQTFEVPGGCDGLIRILYFYHMRTTTLGNSGLKATELGLGMAALGRPGYINLNHGKDLGTNVSIENMERNAHAALDKAWELGIRYFDAARSYGKAEYFLSTWLRKRQIQPEDLTVASKWGYVYTADWNIQAAEHEVKVHTRDNFLKQWEESKQLLGEYINLYQIHSATLQSGVLGDTATLDALSKLKTSGVKIGLSLSGSQQHETLYKAMQVRLDGTNLFDTVQATWNLMETSVEEALVEAHDRGMGVIIKEAMANGRLMTRVCSDHMDRNPLNDLCQRMNCSSDALALAVTINRPFVDVVLSGAVTPEQLYSNTRYETIDLTKFHLDELNCLKQDTKTYWDERSAMEWN